MQTGFEKPTTDYIFLKSAYYSILSNATHTYVQFWGVSRINSRRSIISTLSQNNINKNLRRNSCCETGSNQSPITYEGPHFD